MQALKTNSYWLRILPGFVRVTPLLVLLFFPISSVVAQEALDEIRIISKPLKLGKLKIRAAKDKFGGRWKNAMVLVIESDMRNLEYGPEEALIENIHNPPLDTLFLTPDPDYVVIRRKNFRPFDFSFKNEGISFDSSRAWKLTIAGFKIQKEIAITVTTNPAGATISIDGQKQEARGEYNVTLGYHELLVEKAGYVATKKIIESTNSQTQFHVDLGLTVTISTEPADALVYVDGVFYPEKRINLKPGRYNLEIKRDDYLSYLGKLFVTESDTLFKISLAPTEADNPLGNFPLSFRLPAFYFDFNPPAAGEFKLNSAYGLGAGIDLRLLKQFCLSLSGAVAIGPYYYPDQFGGDLESSAYYPFKVSAGLSQKLRINEALFVLRGAVVRKIINFDDASFKIKANGYHAGLSLEIPTRENTTMGLELVYNFLKYDQTVVAGSLAPLVTKLDASNWSFSFYLGILP